MRLGWLGALVAAAVLAALVLDLTSGSDEPSRAEPRAVRSDDVAPREGAGRLIAALPEVGRLTWRCDREGRSSTTLALPRLGSTVAVTVGSDDRRLFKGKWLDPPDPPRGDGRLATPFEHVRRQRWRIHYRHKPGTILARVRIRFARDEDGDCFASRAITDVRTAR